MRRLLLAKPRNTGITAAARRRRSAASGPLRSFTPPKDRKSTRLNSSHSQISYAVFCLKKKNRHVVCAIRLRAPLAPSFNRQRLFLPPLHPALPPSGVLDLRHFLDARPACAC